MWGERLERSVDSKLFCLAWVHNVMLTRELCHVSVYSSRDPSTGWWCHSAGGAIPPAVPVSHNTNVQGMVNTLLYKCCVSVADWSLIRKYAAVCAQLQQVVFGSIRS